MLTHFILNVAGKIWKCRSYINDCLDLHVLVESFKDYRFRAAPSMNVELFVLVWTCQAHSSPPVRAHIAPHFRAKAVSLWVGVCVCIWKGNKCSFETVKPSMLWLPWCHLPKDIPHKGSVIDHNRLVWSAIRPTCLRTWGMLSVLLITHWSLSSL